MNVADSEVVASVMKMAGYELADNEAEADAIFLNTCSIRKTPRTRYTNGSTSSSPTRRKRVRRRCSECLDAWLSA